MDINEVIELNGNEGLEIDFSRIEYNAAPVTGQPSHPTWVKAQFTPSEIVANVNILSNERGIVRFTENDLEAYLREWLEYHFNRGIKSFRWMWDKFRNYKAA